MTGFGLEQKNNIPAKGGVRRISAPPAEACAFRPLRGNIPQKKILAAAKAAGIMDEFTGEPLADMLSSFLKSGVTLLAARCFDDCPEVTSAAAVLREDPEKAAKGLRLAAKACGAGKILVAAASQAEAKFFIRGGNGIPVRSAETGLPASLRLLRALGRGGEKAALVGVQACAALADAADGFPQSETVVTAAGDGFHAPGNYRVRIGAPVQDVLTAAGIDENTHVVAVGSPVTGEALTDPQQPVTPETRCCYALKKLPPQRSHACVRCGRCERVCPADIVPWLVHRELESGRPDPLLLFHVGSCVRCGACTAECPSRLPLMEEVLLAAKEKEGGL